MVDERQNAASTARHSHAFLRSTEGDHNLKNDGNALSVLVQDDQVALSPAPFSESITSPSAPPSPITTVSATSTPHVTVPSENAAATLRRSSTCPSVATGSDLDSTETAGEWQGVHSQHIKGVARPSSPVLQHADDTRRAAVALDNRVQPGLTSGTATLRPLRHRSESLPSFPDADALQARQVGREKRSMLFEYGHPCDVQELPADPRSWSPSQLSVYLAHVLKLTPKPVIADVMRFVVKSGLTGRRFLRMREKDLVEMGINISWCRILSKARERLRHKCLRGRIFGFAGPTQGGNRETSPSPEVTQAHSEEETDITSYFLSVPSRRADTEGDRNSWRRKEGKRSRGRVKGIAQVFEIGLTHTPGSPGQNLVSEEELNEVARIRQTRSRQSSIDTNISEDEDLLRDRKIGRLGSEHLPQGYYAETTDLISRRDESASLHLSAGNDLPVTREEEDTAAFGQVVDWAAVEPITLEETGALPVDLLEATREALPACFEGDGALADRDAVVERGERSLALSPSIYESSAQPYQSKILAHGEEAYSPVRPKARRLSSQRQEGSEATYSPSFPLFVDHAAPAGNFFDSAFESEASFNRDLPFADNERNIITARKLKKAQSMENFDSIKIEAVHSARSSTKSKGRAGLAALFEEQPSSTDHEKVGRGDDGREGADEENTRFYSLRSRDGGKVVISPREFEEMQVRLRDMETQLAEARSAVADDARMTVGTSHAHSGSSVSAAADQEKHEGMSEWVRGALSETRGAVGQSDLSWLGLGGWALAAGLGIGIVVGEAVLGKLRR